MVKNYDMSVRLSNIADAGDLMEIDALVWNETTTPAPITWTSKEQYLQSYPPGSQLVAVLDGKVVGYVGYTHPTPLSTNKHVYDINIAVHPNYQGKGVGRRLIGVVKEFASQNGIHKLSLRVLATNPKAIRLYESCGFQIQGRLVQEFLLKGTYVDDILMWCPVDKS